MKPTGGSVDEFVAGVRPPVRQRDALTLIEMMREISGREPELWGTIIGFGSCHYVYETGTEGDMPLIAFAPRAAASTLYVLDAADHVGDLAQIGPHSVSKACIYLKDLSKNDLGALRRIIQSSYDQTVSEPTDYATIRVNY